MILCIDDNYFNPLQITKMTQLGMDTLVYFVDGCDTTFFNWKVSDLAAEINQRVKEF